MNTFKSHYHNQTGGCPVCEEERDDCGKCGVPGSQQWNSKIYSWLAWSWCIVYNDHYDFHAHCIVYFAFKALKKGGEVLVVEASDNKETNMFSLFRWKGALWGTCNISGIAAPVKKSKKKRISFISLHSILFW